MEEIRKFLSEPEEHQDEFWESDALIWVDWRDFDESIIEYFNKKLPDEDKIQFECVETEKERGVDIFMKRMVSAHRSPTQMIVPTVTLH